ncbi:MAG: hypothetical protein ACOX7X_07915 [Methanosarcina flavescens]
MINTNFLRKSLTTSLLKRLERKRLVGVVGVINRRNGFSATVSAQ